MGLYGALHPGVPERRSRLAVLASIDYIYISIRLQQAASEIDPACMAQRATVPLVVIDAQLLGLEEESCPELNVTAVYGSARNLTYGRIGNARCKSRRG